MTICIDCRMIDSSGIGVYLRGCLPFFLDTDNNFYLIGSSQKLKEFISIGANIEILECSVKPFSLQELFFFPGGCLSKINSGDRYFSPFFNIPGGIKIPVFTAIHDIIFPDIPELTSKPGLAVRMWFYRRAFAKSQNIFTVSEFSKLRIEHYSEKKNQTVITYSAIQPKFLEYRDKALSREKNETIIFIGNIKKHKGLDYLLDAFILAKNDGLPHKLVIIGEKNNFRTSDNKMMEKIDVIGNDTVSFTGFISDEQLMERLSTAALLVQPSLYEGFCLPPLEAMILGTQALISDIPVLKEIYADYPVKSFRAGDVYDLKNKLMEMLYNKKPEVIILPMELVLKYTFEKTASVILRYLNRLNGRGAA